MTSRVAALDPASRSRARSAIPSADASLSFVLVTRIDTPRIRASPGGAASRGLRPLAPKVNRTASASVARRPSRSGRRQRLELPRFRRHLNASGRKPGEREDQVPRTRPPYPEEFRERRSVSPDSATSLTAGSRRIWGSPTSGCATGSRRRRARGVSARAGSRAMSARSSSDCGMRTRRCGWSGRSCEKRRSSSRGRTTGGRRGVLAYRCGEDELSRRCDVPCPGGGSTGPRFTIGSAERRRIARSATLG
jgi:hypothetical protein